MTAPLGEAAAQTEADLLVALLTSNPKLADGTAVFHASRGNIAEPGAPSVEALAEARLAMRTRTGLDGKTIINATPRFVVVPPDLETEAERVLATIQPTTADDVNPFGGRLSLLVEPRLPEATWYVFASPAQLAGMQYAYLSAAQGVQIQRTETWDVLGMKFRAFLDFGAGWLDWRGAHKVPGGQAVALTLAQLTADRDALMAARAQGVRPFRDPNGEEVEYKSPRSTAGLPSLPGVRRPTPSSSERRKNSEMKNFVQRGRNITVPAPAPAVSGAVVNVGEIIGIASGDAAAGEPLDIVTVGVFEVPKVAADAFPLGGAVFWRASDGLVTADDGEGANPKIGVAVAAAAASTGIVRVRLSGTF